MRAYQQRHQRAKQPTSKFDKLIAQYHQQMTSKQYPQAAQLAVKALKLKPASIQCMDYVMRAHFQLYNWQEVIKYCNKILAINPNHLNALDAMSHAYGGLHDFKSAKPYGLKALQKRDKTTIDELGGLDNLPALLPLPNWAQPTAKHPSTGKNVISFSLFGDLPEYIEPAVLNTELVKDIYPNWVCRFYIDDSVPQQAIERLQQNGTEIIKIDDSLAHLPKTTWRFLAMDDPEVNRVIFRDADSVISFREAKAVEAWITSGKRFHTIRDAASHTELVLAGLWGAIVGSTPNVKNLLDDFVNEDKVDARFADQHFLRYKLWQYIRQDLYGTDSVFDFLDSHPFPNGNGTENGTKIDRHDFHVGTRESRSRFDGNYDKPDGTKIDWFLYSQINPLINDDLTYTLLPKKRLICRYPATIRNKSFTAFIPKRYALGINSGETSISVKEIKKEVN